MADKSLISWTDATWPVVAGCTRVSPACDHCFAIRDSWRMGHNPNPKIRTVYEGTVEPGPIGSQVDRSLDWSGTVRPLPQRLDWPLRWKKPRRIFVCSMSDLFHESVPDEFIDRVFAVMACCDGARCSKPRHTFQILTKRPERMLAYLSDPETPWRIHSQFVYDITVPGWYPQPFGTLDTAAWDPWPLPNVHIGVTAENQAMADARIPVLLQVPAAVRFVSVEPCLGPVDLSEWLPWWQDPTPGVRLDWVIAGSESGPGRRPAEMDWFRFLCDQCASSGMPFFLKQINVDGKLVRSPELDGRQWHEFPEGKGEGR